MYKCPRRMIPTIIPLAAHFVLGLDRALHWSTWLLDFFAVLLLVLYVNGVRFFLVQDQIEVVQLTLSAHTFTITFTVVTLTNTKTRLQALI